VPHFFSFFVKFISVGENGAGEKVIEISERKTGRQKTSRNRRSSFLKRTDIVLNRLPHITLVQTSKYNVSTALA
jgi:hypothetical protein